MSRPLFFQQRFWPMWTALCLGAFADNMLRQALMIGLAFAAIGIGGVANADPAIPVIGALFAVAMLVFSPLAGQIAEKYETARLFRRIKFVEIVLMTVAAFGFYTKSGWVLIAAMAGMGAQSAFFSPVRMSAMPKYLRPDELVRGNGFCTAGLFVAVLTGMFLGGLMIAAPAGGASIAGFLFFAALIGWLAILKAPRAAPTDPALRLDWNILAQAARIIGFAFSAPGVARPTLGAAFFWFVSTLVTVNVTFYARASLGGDEALATTIMGLFAIGAGAGAMIASALAKQKSGLGASTIAVAGAALAAIAVYGLTDAAAAAARGSASADLLIASPAGAALAGAFCLTAACMGLFVVPLQAATQRRAPTRARARIMAASNMLNAAAAIAGSLSVLFVTETALDPQTAFLAVAALQTLVALYMWRRRRQVPAGLHDESLAALGDNQPPPTLCRSVKN